MAGKSDYLENKIIDWIVRGQAMPSAPVPYIALLTSTKGPIQRSTTYAVNDTASFKAADGKCHLYKCTAQSSATAGAAPSFPGVAAEVITDGGVTWTEQDAALDAGTAIVEPSYTGYARVKAAAGASAALTDWKSTQNDNVASTGSSGQTSNSAAVTFGAPSAGATAYVWGMALLDALTAGNPLFWGGLTDPKTINVGDPAPSFAIGALTYTEG